MNLVTLTYDPRITRIPAVLPLSKSVALRVMALNALAAALNQRPAAVKSLPDADDVKGMKRAMDVYFRQLMEIQISKVGGEGCVAPDSSASEAPFKYVNIGQGGAPLRFFIALAASTPGVRIELDCDESLKRRPHSILVNKLREAGADIEGSGEDGCRPPYRITGSLLSPGALSIDAGVSSQYISALMMASPLWTSGLELSLTGGRVVSMPYIVMTAALMRLYGLTVNIIDNHIQVLPANPGAAFKTPEDIRIPEDWSAASYFYEIAAISRTTVMIDSLTPPSESLQGDAAAEKLFDSMGVSTIEQTYGGMVLFPDKVEAILGNLAFDFTDCPDLVPAVAVAACLCGYEFTFTGVGHLRHKETDRVAALIRELAKLGYLLESTEETLSWKGHRCTPVAVPRIATYSDHRMAMAFAPAAIRFQALSIENPEVVNKSFPGYWKQLSEMGFKLSWSESY